jgi:hypothetical protein
MFNPFGNDKHLAMVECDRAIPQLDVERSFEDKKKIVCLVMFVPVERVRGENRSANVPSLSVRLAGASIIFLVHACFMNVVAGIQYHIESHHLRR